MPSPSERLASLSIESVDDTLIVEQVDGYFELSESFRIIVELTSNNTRYRLDVLALRKVMLTLHDHVNPAQVFNGYISSLTTGKLGTDRRREYTIVITPWFELLKYRKDCCTYRKMCVVEIMAQIFRRYPQAHYDISALGKNHPVRDYCVQYNETDFDFVRRLCEEEGIYFYFHHSTTGHKMVLDDWGFARVPFHCDTQVTCEAAGQPHFYHWSSKRTIDSPTAITRRHHRWNPVAVASEEAFTQQPPGALADQTFEHYAYPIDTPIDDGKLSFRDHVRTHLGRNPPGMRRIKARGNYLGLEPGMLVQVSKHDQAKQIGSYQLIGLRLRLMPTAQLATDHPQADTHAPYIIEVHAQLIDSDVRYIPPLRTPKPCISNVQTAKVVGPPEQELYTDSFARIKVQFHWDRYGHYDGRNSPWLRCAAHWSGNDYGTQFIPRQGQEVLTACLSGYPHWPLVRATLPNPDNMLPFTPEQTPTRTGIKTHSIESDDLQQGHLMQFDDQSSPPSIKL